MSRVGLAAATITALLSGCAGAGSEESAAPARSSSGYGLTESRDDLKDLRRTSWSLVSRAAGTITVAVSSGTPRCRGVHVETTETADRVVVAAYVGTVPDAPDECQLDAVENRVEVRLRSPLGSRKVVDAPRPATTG